MMKRRIRRSERKGEERKGREGNNAPTEASSTQLTKRATQATMVSDSSTSDFTPAVIINCDESTAGIAPTKDHHAPATRRVARTSSTCSITSTNVSDNGSDAVVAAVVAVDHHDNENTTKKKEIKSSSSSSSSSSASSFRLVRYLSDLPHWQSYNDSQEHFIQQMPKIELHVHLDGSFDPDFLWQYMQDNNPSSILECLPCQAVLPWDEENKTLPVRQLVQDCLSSQDYHKLCTCRGHRSLKQMLNCFEIFLPLVRRNLDLLEQLAFDFCRRQYQQNVVYTEVRYSPFLLAEGFVVENHDDNNNQQQQQNGDKNYTGAIDGAAVFRAITAGLRRGSHKFNIVVNQILCAITWRPDWAQPTLDLVLEHWHDYPCATVGIDIAAGEGKATRVFFLYFDHVEIINIIMTCEI
jgi:Adenosine deaminase